MASEETAAAPESGRFRFELATPEALAASGDYGLVIVPGSEGDFGVLAGHAALISSLRPGVVRAWREAAGGLPPDEAPEVWFVTGGFAEAGEGRLTLLVQEAEPVGEMDAAEIGQLLRNAREDLEDVKGDDEAARDEIRARIVLLEARLAACSEQKN
ncbi:MAG: ATP synthase F1 subunit epsilon [Alphaproteobacteria bacterium]|nr:ATP synthase F1 subunit epsilon [Alphaproteobacteria bacterium]MDA7987270.1 ATP synthase F1 subunit epsilon [Alphaproteobacteria bacterium]